MMFVSGTSASARSCCRTWAYRGVFTGTFTTAVNYRSCHFGEFPTDMIGMAFAAAYRIVAFFEQKFKMVIAFQTFIFVNRHMISFLITGKKSPQRIFYNPRFFISQNTSPPNAYIARIKPG